MALYAKIDVALARDPDLIGYPLARLLYIQAFCYGRENLTDGAIDRRLLPLVAPDIPTPAKHVAYLVTIGKLEETPTGWRIPEGVWRRYNPLKSEVDEMRRAEADRKKSYRDKARTNGHVPTGQTEESR
jgi:hypothetical protein